MIELALFGSIVQDEFRPDSDIDVLITLISNHSWGIEIVTMREELSVLCKRSIILADIILATQQVLRHAETLERDRLAQNDEKQAAILY